MKSLQSAIRSGKFFSGFAILLAGLPALNGMAAEDVIAYSCMTTNTASPEPLTITYGQYGEEEDEKTWMFATPSLYGQIFDSAKDSEKKLSLDKKATCIERSVGIGETIPDTRLSLDKNTLQGKVRQRFFRSTVLILCPFDRSPESDQTVEFMCSRSQE